MESHSASTNTRRVAGSHECCPPSVKSKHGASWVGRALVAIGISGAALAALCCVAPFLLAGLLGALGLGFILNDAILVGLLIVFTAVAVLGYYLMRRAKHA